MIPRRSILTRAAALVGMAFAPVAAWAGRKRGRSLLTQQERDALVRAAKAASAAQIQLLECINDDHQKRAREARALLAEARDWFYAPKHLEPDGPMFRMEPGGIDLFERIDVHLGRGAGREG